ncbi:MAG: pre-peptidase C-terminal domain-containing protein, partial [Methanomassiliicoccales archaeon]|nr:pre-peptidase C-terminal domain-containing protein [Methanomassiliicoccales archaeon]
MKRAIVLALLGMFVMTAAFAALPAQASPSQGEEAPADDSPGHHLITYPEMLELRAKLGVRQEGVDYNVIVDGFGTGLAPPSEEGWEGMVGNVRVPDNEPADGLGLPASYDLSAQGYFPKVGNQGSQGSCGAWASIYYAYGYLEAKDNGWSDAKAGTNTSHLMSPAWAYNRVNGGTDRGSWMSENFQVAVDWGVASMKTMPYSASDLLSWGSPAAFREAPLHKASSYQEYYYTGDAAVSNAKTWLTQDIPVTFALDANYYVFDNGAYIVTSAEYNSDSLNHAQTLVGYDDSITEDGEVGAFRVVNSWGSSWGDSGYYWLTYAAFKEISNRAGVWMTTVVDAPDYVPSLLATWYFNTAPLRSCSLTVAKGVYPAEDMSVSPWWEGDTLHRLPAFMCLDISSFRSSFDAGASSFWMEVSDGGSAVLSSFKLEAYGAAYASGAAALASAQSSQVPATLPGHASVRFFKYDVIDPATALDRPGLSLSTSGQACWVAVNHTSYSGGSSMQSGAVADSATSTLQATFSGASSASFRWKVSSESGKDLLRFYVDGSLRNSTSGIDGWAQISTALSSGGHVLRWDYVRDADDCANSDAAWVDALAIVPADDPYEENDAWTSAKALDPRSSYGGLVALDADWFKVSMGAEDALGVSMQLNNTEGDLDLYLYASDGTTLLASSATEGGTETASMEASSAGYYYICVLPDPGQSASYQLSFDYEPSELDLGKTSSLSILSGTGDLADLSGLAVTVEAGGALAGTLSLRSSVSWDGSETVPLAGTPSWGDSFSSYWQVEADLSSGTSDHTASVALTAPAAPGTYYLIFAFRNESSAALVASATAASVGAPVWGDGNDVAGLTADQVAACQADGRALASWLMPDGMHFVRLPCAALTVNVIPADSVAPLTTASLSGTAGQDGWYRSAVTVALSATDQGGVGVRETWYRVDSGPWNLYAAAFAVTGSAVHDVDFYSVDLNGNTEAQKDVEVLIDTVSPTTSVAINGTLGAGGWYVSTISLQISAYDAVSGVQFSYYRVNGGSWRTYGTTTVIYTEGALTIDYYSIDAAGNSDSVRKAYANVDRSAPMTSATLEGEGQGGWYRGDVQVALLASDASSGAGAVQYSLDGSAWGAYSSPIGISGEG